MTPETGMSFPANVLRRVSSSFHESKPNSDNQKPKHRFGRHRRRAGQGHVFAPELGQRIAGQHMQAQIALPDAEPPGLFGEIPDLRVAVVENESEFGPGTVEIGDRDQRIAIGAAIEAFHGVEAVARLPDPVGNRLARPGELLGRARRSRPRPPRASPRFRPVRFPRHTRRTAPRPPPSKRAGRSRPFVPQCLRPVVRRPAAGHRANCAPQRASDRNGRHFRRRAVPGFRS